MKFERKKTSYLQVKNPPASLGDLRDMGSIPGLGRSIGGGNSNPLQYSCLENPMNRGAWWAMVHRVMGRVGHKVLYVHCCLLETSLPVVSMI